MSEKGPRISVKTPRLPSFAEFAAANPRQPPGAKCWICSRPEAVAIVNEYLAMPEPRPPHRVVADYLLKALGCPLRIVSVAGCIRYHGDRR